MKLCKDFCKENVDIKLVFTSFKIKNCFSYKGPISDDLKSFLVYKIICASCSSCYIGKTCRPFKTRIEEHIKKDNRSHIFKHLHSTATCFDSYNFLSFKIIDKANFELDLKIKEAFYCVSLSSIIFIIFDIHCWLFLLSRLHFATISSHYNTPRITLFSFIYYFQYLCANYWHLLLSWLHFAIISFYYNTPCNRFYDNYGINNGPRILLWLI